MNPTVDEQCLHGKRVLVLASYDSFLKSATRYAEMLAGYGARVEYVLTMARPRQISKAQREGMGFSEAIPVRTVDTVATREYLEAFDILLLSLDGQRTRQFTALFLERFAEAPKRPITLSFYPGLVFRFHLEGFCSRASSDLVLLNSPADTDLYRAMLEGVGVHSDNSLCAGLVLLDSLRNPSPPRKQRDGQIVFMGQPTVPIGHAERAYVVDQLIRHAKSYPRERFLLKPRHRPGETTLHQTRYHYQSLLESRPDVPPNLSLTYAPIASVLADTKLCLTYSSTAALEAVTLGIPTRVLTDFGIHENIGNHFFLGSGMLADLSEVHPEMEHRCDPEWLTQHARAAVDQEAAIIARVRELLTRQQALGRSLPPPHDRLFARSPAYAEFLRRTQHETPPWQFGEPTGWARQTARLGALAVRLWGVATRRSGRRFAKHGAHN